MPDTTSWPTSFSRVFAECRARASAPSFASVYSFGACTRLSRRALRAHADGPTRPGDIVSPGAPRGASGPRPPLHEGGTLNDAALRAAADGDHRQAPLGSYARRTAKGALPRCSVSRACFRDDGGSRQNGGAWTRARPRGRLEIANDAYPPANVPSELGHFGAQTRAARRRRAASSDAVLPYCGVGGSSSSGGVCHIK